MTDTNSNRLPVLAAEIRAAHSATMDAAKTAAERAVECGHALLEAKALVKHGQWLPWLKEHCRLSERTAQFYMKIAKLGLKSETVAVLGIKAASETIKLAYPDPFAEKTQAEHREWLLYTLLAVRDGLSVERADGYVHWLARNNWTSPDDWLGEVGNRYRAFWKMQPIPDAHREAWAAHLAANDGRTLEEIDAELAMLAQAVAA